MLRSVKSLRGYAIRAKNGDLGKVREMLFDDRFWMVCYVVVDTGNWLAGRLVLLASSSLGQPAGEGRVLPANLTKEQVADSPSISTDEPVSRQMELELHSYYGWPPYWEAGAYVAVAPTDDVAEQKGDPHLRSTREVIGYAIHARDGQIGHVDDFVVEDEIWSIRYMVVDVRQWLSVKRVLVAPHWAEEVDWARRRVNLDLSKEVIENSPKFDPSAPVNRQYEVRLYDYYGRPHYWSRLQE
jgi:hypothetical protein